METQECMDIFETVLTDDGICCTFNSVYREFMINNVRQSDVLDSEKYNDKYTGVDWTPENGFPPIIKVNIIFRFFFGIKILFYNFRHFEKIRFRCQDQLLELDIIW